MPEKGFAEIVKDHWFIVFLGVAGSAAATSWFVANEVLVKPRDFKISNLTEEVSGIRKAATNRSTEYEFAAVDCSVRAGEAFTLQDGLLTFQVTGIEDKKVNLNVSLGSTPPEVFKEVAIGRRLSFTSKTYNYFLDIKGIRGNIVDVLASKVKH